LVSNLISQWNEEIVEQANILAKSLNTLTSIRDNFTDKVTKEHMCAVIVSENLFDENIKEKLYFNNTESKTCLNYLSEIEEIKEKQMDDIEKLKLMNHKVDEFKKEIKPENSIDNIIELSAREMINGKLTTNTYHSYFKPKRRKNIDFI